MRRRSSTTGESRLLIARSQAPCSPITMRRRSSTTGDSGDPATATSAAHPECALNPIAAGTGLGMNIDYTLDAGVMNLGGYQQRYRAELLERVIPFWLRHSLDREHGGYFTCLTREGAVYD